MAGELAGWLAAWLPGWRQERGQRSEHCDSLTRLFTDALSALSLAANINVEGVFTTIANDIVGRMTDNADKSVDLAGGSKNVKLGKNKQKKKKKGCC